MMFVRRPRFRHLRLVTSLALLAGGPLRAQYAKYEGLTVRNIQFDPVRQPLEAAELHEILPMKIGAPLSRAEVRASIERLFAGWSGFHQFLAKDSVSEAIITR